MDDSSTPSVDLQHYTSSAAGGRTFSDTHLPPPLPNIPAWTLPDDSEPVHWPAD